MFQSVLVSLLVSVTAPAADLVSVERVSLAGAHGMEVLDDGRVLMTDTYKSMRTPRSFLYVRERDSWFRTPFAGEGLAGVSVAGDGYLVCDLLGSRVIELDRRFRPRREWKVPSPWIARLGPGGVPYALTARGELARLSPTGKVQILIAGLDAPFDFAPADRADEIWISEQGKHQGRVSRWKLWSSPNILHGERVLDARGPFANPEGLAFVDGKLFVVDTEAGHLARVSADGLTEVIQNGLGLPILVRPAQNGLMIYSNRYLGAPSLLRLRL